MKQRLEGYFTVEAVMVLPMVLMTILLVIYLLFFQYNRCLMEQDIGVLALRGTALQAEDNDDRIQQLREQAEQLYCDKYVAWESGEIGLKIEKGTICVQQKGQMTFPFREELSEGDRTWTTTVDYENHMVSPVSFIRSYRKIMGGE